MTKHKKKVVLDSFTSHSNLVAAVIAHETHQRVKRMVEYMETTEETPLDLEYREFRQTLLDAINTMDKNKESLEQAQVHIDKAKAFILEKGDDVRPKALELFNSVLTQQNALKSVLGIL